MVTYSVRPDLYIELLAEEEIVVGDNCGEPD